MATLEELQDALRNADRAGATDDARKLADAIIAIQSQQAHAPAATKQQLTEDPGFSRSSMIAAGHTFDRLLDGAAQMYLGARGEGAALNGLKQNVDSKEASYAPLKEARPVSTGIGEALPLIALPGGGAKTLGGNMVRMAASGGIPAALEYGSLQERLSNGLRGAAFGAAVPAAGALFKTAKAFVEPLYQSGREAIAGRLLNLVAGDAAPAVASRLRSATELVPGSAPTSGQVAQSGGVAALERAAAQANPEAYTQRAMEQANARLNALRGIAGDDASMAAAVAARNQASGPLFEQATKAVYAVDPALQNILNRPAVQQAMARAKTLAENNGRPFSFSVDPSNPFSGLGITSNKTQQITGRGLQDLKMAMDEMLADPASGFSGKAGDAVRNLRGQLLDWMEGANPAFKQARNTHAQMSKPINQMQVGQHLLDKVQPALADFGALGQESGAQYARALRNADQTVKAATQFKGNKGLADVMAPEQMGTLEAIAQDLARKSNAQNLGRGVGSDTFQKLSMNNIAQQSGMPRMMGGLLEFPGISRATRWVYGNTDNQMQGLLADTLLNPQAAADLMSKASEKTLLSNSPKSRKVLEQGLLRFGLLGAPAPGSFANP